MKKLLAAILVGLMMLASMSFTYAEEPVTLTIMTKSEWMPGGNAAESTGETSVVVTKILEEYKKRYPNVTLEFEALVGDTAGYNSYLLRGSADTLPDISMLDGYWIAAFASQGYTYSMNGRIDQHILDEYYDAFEMRYNGETHGLVYSTAYNGVVWYRKSMLKEAGYDAMPTEWDEFWKAIEAMSIPEERYGMAMSMSVTESTTCSLLGPFWAGEDVFVDDENVANFNNETSVRLFNQFRKEFEAGVLPPESLTLDYTGAQDLFVKGKAATLVHGSWLCTAWNQLAPEFADDVGIALLPKDPVTGIASQNAGGWSFAITTDDTSKDEYISAFLDLMLIDPEFAPLRIAESGEIPVTKTIGEKGFDWIPEEYRGVIEAVLPDSQTRPVVSSYPVASEYYNIAFQSAVMGEKDAEAALTEAEEKLAEYVFDNDL